MGSMVGDRTYAELLQWCCDKICMKVKDFLLQGRSFIHNWMWVFTEYSTTNDDVLNEQTTRSRSWQTIYYIDILGITRLGQPQVALWQSCVYTSNCVFNSTFPYADIFVLNLSFNVLGARITPSVASFAKEMQYNVLIQQ